MSFKQAKELVERLELAEVSIKKSTDDLNTSSHKFNEALKKQVKVIRLIPRGDKKINNLRMLVMLNLGFIIGLIVGATLI